MECPNCYFENSDDSRFSNELKFVRKVAHRNVCKMYGLGEKE